MGQLFRTAPDASGAAVIFPASGNWRPRREALIARAAAADGCHVPHLSIGGDVTGRRARFFRTRPAAR